jgi:hypothetical protein
MSGSESGSAKRKVATRQSGRLPFIFECNLCIRRNPVNSEFATKTPLVGNGSAPIAERERRRMVWYVWHCPVDQSCTRLFGRNNKLRLSLQSLFANGSRVTGGGIAASFLAAPRCIANS